MSLGEPESRKDSAMHAAALVKPIDPTRFFLLVATTLSLATAALAMTGVTTMF